MFIPQNSPKMQGGAKLKIIKSLKLLALPRGREAMEVGTVE
jgi:hypothetical protein